MADPAIVFECPALDRDLVLRTLAVLTDVVTSLGHRAQVVPWESRGNCVGDTCSESCRAWRAVFLEWAEILEVLDTEQPTQLTFIAEAV